MHLSVLLFGQVEVWGQAFLQELAILPRRLDVRDPEAIPDDVLILAEKARVRIGRSDKLLFGKLSRGGDLGGALLLHHDHLGGLEFPNIYRLLNSR